MAKIRNSIHLQDRMTPVFKSMLKSMDSTLKAMDKLDKQASRGMQSKAFKQAERDIKRANNQLIKMQNHTEQASNKFGRINNETDKISKNMANIGKSGFNLVNLSAAVYMLKNIKNLTQDILGAADMGVTLGARLELLSDGAFNKDEIMHQLYKTAIASRTGLEQTGDLLARIMVSDAMSGESSTAGAFKLTELINKSLVAGGGNQQQNERAMLQLAQALSLGQLQGIELRSLTKQAPYLMKILAEGLGEVDDSLKNLSVGHLKQLGAEGKLTSDKIIKAFLLMEDKINEAFRNAPKTFEQAMTQMKTTGTYLLSLLKSAEGPLEALNNRIWQLADYLSSAEGIPLLESIGNGIKVMVDIVLWGVDVIVAAFTWLSDHTEVVQAAFITLGIVAAGAATIATVAWVAATWPILLVVAAIGLAIYGFIQFGFTAGQVVGAIIGSIMWLGAVIWNLVLLIIGGASVVVSVVWNLFQGLLMLIWNGLAFIGALFQTVFYDIAWVISSAMELGVIAVEGMVVTVLELLQWVAKGIDFIFGSNLAGTIDGWIGSVKGLSGKIQDMLDPDQYGLLQEDVWKNAPWVGLDNWAVDPFAAVDGMVDMGWFADPDKAFNSGMNFGKGLDRYLDNLDFSIDFDNLPDILGGFDMDNLGINVRGGDLDSIGKIKSDVDISDEDIKLLRDMAAKEFLLNLSTITPSANINFGDVRETADVNVIMEIIEDMVENAFATSLVTD